MSIQIKCQCAHQHYIHYTIISRLVHFPHFQKGTYDVLYNAVQVGSNKTYTKYCYHDAMVKQDLH